MQAKLFTTLQPWIRGLIHTLFEEGPGTHKGEAGSRLLRPLCLCFFKQRRSLAGNSIDRDDAGAALAALFRYP